MEEVGGAVGGRNRGGTSNVCNEWEEDVEALEDKGVRVRFVIKQLPEGGMDLEQGEVFVNAETPGGICMARVIVMTKSGAARVHGQRIPRPP